MEGLLWVGERLVKIVVTVGRTGARMVHCKKGGIKEATLGFGR
jgi:hypothetical protein